MTEKIGSGLPEYGKPAVIKRGNLKNVTYSCPNFSARQDGTTAPARELISGSSALSG